MEYSTMSKDTMNKDSYIQKTTGSQRRLEFFTLFPSLCYMVSLFCLKLLLYDPDTGFPRYFERTRHSIWLTPFATEQFQFSANFNWLN